MAAVVAVALLVVSLVVYPAHRGVIEANVVTVGAGACDKRGYAVILDPVSSYRTRTNRMTADPRLYLNTVVNKVEHNLNGDSVPVSIENRLIHKAKAIILTVSSIVLQSKLIEYVLDLPACVDLLYLSGEAHSELYNGHVHGALYKEQLKAKRNWSKKVHDLQKKLDTTCT